MLIDVGGRRLFLDRAGEGRPTVVLESGSDWGSDAWDSVWSGLQSLTRVCRYDRAGLGQSDPAPGERTGAGAVDDLHRALQTAGVSGPYVLVGHSFGGLLVRLFAHRYPDEVAGLVLVDSCHPEQRRRMGAVLPPPTPGESPMLAEGRQFYSNRDFRFQEGFRFDGVLAEVAALGDLRDLPLAVIGRALPADDEALAKARAGLPPVVGWALEHAWQALQQELVGLSTNSRYVRADGSGHLVQIDRPDLVFQVVRELVDSLRSLP